MVYICEKDCFDSKKCIYYKRGQVVSSVSKELLKHFKAVGEPVNENAVLEEYKILVKKLGLTPKGVQEIMKANGIKGGKGAEEKLIPILKSLLANKEKAEK